MEQKSGGQNMAQPDAAVQRKSSRKSGKSFRRGNQEPPKSS